MKHILKLAMIVSVALISFSCEGEKVIPVESITLNRTTVLATRFPRVVALNTTIVPLFATHQMVTWSTNNPEIATVNNYGLVTVHGLGEATITATVEGGKTASALIRGIIAVLPDPPTIETIETYEVDPNLGLEPVEDFNEIEGSRDAPTGVVGHFIITKMSPRLDSFRMAYAAAVPEFKDFRLVKPSITTSTSTLDWRSMAFRITYTNTNNVWNFVTANADISPLVGMTGADDNPDFHARFSVLARVDRTTGFSGGSTPHSTTIGGLSGALLAAVRGIFNPGTTTSTLVVNNESLVGTLCLPAGWNVFHGADGAFWFRSRANSTDWFKVEREVTP